MGKVEKNCRKWKTRKKFMGKYHLYITGSEMSLKLDQKALDKKFIRQKNIGQKDVDKVSLDDLMSDKKTTHHNQFFLGGTI